MLYLHVHLEPGAEWVQAVPPSYNVFAYALGGDLEGVKEGQVAVFGPTGDQVRLAVPPEAREAADVLLIGGAPLNEPVARYGPFVMNTKEEIWQAFEDYRAGRMGQIV